MPIPSGAIDNDKLYKVDVDRKVLVTATALDGGVTFGVGEAWAHRPAAPDQLRERVRRALGRRPWRLFAWAALPVALPFVFLAIVGRRDAARRHSAAGYEP